MKGKGYIKERLITLLKLMIAMAIIAVLIEVSDQKFKPSDILKDKYIVQPYYTGAMMESTDYKDNKN